MAIRLPALVLTAALLAPPVTATAQEEKPLRKPAEAARPAPVWKVFPIQYADPDALATLLGKHFGNLAQVSPTNAGLLVSAAPATVEDVARLVDQLDRPARQVVIGVALAEVVRKDKEELPDLTGTSQQVLTKLEEMAKAGQVVSLRRYNLTGVEGKQASVTAGGMKPFTTGRAIAGGAGGGRGGQPAGGFGGAVQRSFEYRDTGTTVTATPRVGADNVVSLDLTVQDSGSGAAGDEEAPAEMTSLRLATRVTMLTGQAVTAHAVRSNEKTARTVTLVIVTAEVESASKAADKSK